jgi:competence protein ComEA
MLRTLAILAAVLVAPVWAQDAMPDGPGKETTVRVCTFCHVAEMFSSSSMSADDWDRTITTMTTDKGITIGDDDYAAVLDYLSKCLGPNSAKININKAAACELTRILKITTQQANAIVAYREKNGNFKDLAGVKKVEGVDAAALEAKKGGISF